MRLKTLYSSREVAALTGLTARQLQWWAQRGLYPPALESHQTDAGGFTERRYTPIELLELMVLGDLRREGFTLARIRQLLAVLKTRFNIRLFDAVEPGGPMTLFIDGDAIYARTLRGEIFSVFDDPSQPLLALGPSAAMRQITARERPARRRAKGSGPIGRRGGSRT